MTVEKRKIFKILMLLLIGLTLAFIAVQSLLPPEVSKAESDAVGEIIEVVIPSDTPAGEQVQRNVRSIGHFVEFAVLGAEIAVYLFFFERKLAWFILAPILSPVVALLDETLQFLSERAPEISDVWVDVLGFVSFFALLTAILYTYDYMKKRMRNKNGENNNG